METGVGVILTPSELVPGTARTVWVPFEGMGFVPVP